MRTYICGSLLALSLLASNAFAADVSIQKVEIYPLSGGISFNSVHIHNAGENWGSWVTAPSVEMRGRKELMIQNVSNNTIIYLTGVSGSTAIGTLLYGERVTFKASSSLHIYVSANTVSQVETCEIR